MFRDPDLQALIEQAERNLDTLELLLREDDFGDDELAVLRQRIEDLKAEYLKETNAITRQVLRRAVERRLGADRRRGISRQSVET